MDFYDKINAIKRELNIKRDVELTEILGISKSALSKYNTNNRPPSKNFINLLFTKLNVRPEWWETGEGEIFENKKSEVINDNLKKLIESNKMLATANMKVVETNAQLVKKLLDHISQENSK